MTTQVKKLLALAKSLGFLAVMYRAVGATQDEQRCMAEAERMLKAANQLWDRRYAD
jgi:hypothetical protein